jgi:hypothetical protein
MSSEYFDTFSLILVYAIRDSTVLTFHNRTVLSSDPEANRSLDEDHAMSLIPLVCPSKFCTNSPVRESHNFISLSAAMISIFLEVE